jgi:flagellar protein FliS
VIPGGNDYLRETVLSATPAQLVTMLYDRLLLDLARAEAAQSRADWSAASGELLHAQEILAELTSSLDTAAWPEGERLLAVYTFLTGTLRRANIERDVELTRSSAALLEPLRTAWHEAAASLAGAADPGARSIAVVA